MSDTSRSCARCRRPAVIARGNAAYCIDCNLIMEWSQVIAIVQNAKEPVYVGSSAMPNEVATTVRAATPAEFTELGKAAVLTGGGGESVEADPFAQRLV